MGGGQLQLNSYKTNNSFLTENPQTTFFKKCYHQYNNFSKLQFTLDVNNITHKSFEYNNTYNITIPKNGDLIKEFYISLTLPKISDPSGSGTLAHYSDIKWVEDIQFKIIKYIKFKIGGQLIQEFNSNTLYFYYNLLLSNEKKALFNLATNQSKINCADSSKCYNEPVNLLIPIPVWFFTDAFPISCLEFMDMEVEFELNNLSDLILVRENNIVNISGTTTKINKSFWRRPLVSESSSPSNRNYKGFIDTDYRLAPEIKTNYIFLEKHELKKFYAHSNRYLIEIYRETLVRDISQKHEYKTDGKFKYNYETHGSTKDVIIAIKSDKNTAFNQHFNFTNLDNLEKTNTNLFQNFFFKIAYEQWDASGGDLIDYLEYFANDTEGTSKNLPRAKFPLIYEQEAISSPNNIIISYKSAFRSKDIVTLRENWNYRSVYKNLIENSNLIPGLHPDLNNLSIQKNIIAELQVKFNKMVRIEPKTCEFYQELNLLKNYPSCSKNSVYIINFAKFPEKKEPSGQCNFSHINHVSFEFKLNLLPSATYDLYIYNRYYNILDLSSGSAKLVYFK